MQILTPYISKEYLALRINYCKQQLAALPEVVMTKRIIRGKPVDVLLTDSHCYRAGSEAGKDLLNACIFREELLCDLSKFEGLWHSSFRGEPPSDIEPRKIIRSFQGANNETIIMNGKFFDSLRNEANTYHPEHKTWFYNGSYYRSSAERDIARFYTEQGIPFKYEPEIRIAGLPYAIYSDFVILIKELDLCKFHEHFGMMNSANYVRDAQTRCSNYSQAGLIPDFDVICTYNFSNMPFDTRTLHAKLNQVVYDTLLMPA